MTGPLRAHMPRIIFHVVCVLLLLIAQQGALVHAMWHANADSHAHAFDGQTHAPDGDDAPLTGQRNQDSLCAVDLAFGQVLGGIHGACALPLAVDLPAAATCYTFNPRLGCEAIPAHSRGPPVLL